MGFIFLIEKDTAGVLELAARFCALGGEDIAGLKERLGGGGTSVSDPGT